MGSGGLHQPKHDFPPPTEEDIKLAWSTVAQLDCHGRSATQANAIARCVYFVEQVRALCGVYRDDLQPWTFPKE